MTVYKGPRLIGIFLVICLAFITISSIGLSQIEESVEKKVQRFIIKGDYEGAVGMLKRRAKMIDGFKRKKNELAVIYYHLARVYYLAGLDEEVDKNLKLAYKTNPALAVEKDEGNLYFQERALKIKPKDPEKIIAKSDVKAIKVYDYNSIKTRSSHQAVENDSFRWFYKSRVITVRREKNQRVLICGGPVGIKSWAVDNAIFINNQEIKGCKSIMANRGSIPETKKLEPYDITRMIAPGENIKLEMKLADYGIFWGNTDIYLIIK